MIDGSVHRSFGSQTNEMVKRTEGSGVKFSLKIQRSYLYLQRAVGR